MNMKGPTAERVFRHLLHLQKGYDSSLMTGSYNIDGEEGSRYQNI